MTKLPSIISWDDAWIIGVDEIDEHHKKLVELIQKLFGALITAQGKDYVSEILAKLIEYTKFHFRREEEIYLENGFDRVGLHQKQHQALIGQVLDITQDILLQGPSEEISDEIYHFLKHWLTDHIIQEDLKFKAFLENKSTS